MSTSDPEQQDLWRLKHEFTAIAALGELVSTPEFFQKDATSELAGDDQLSDPFQVSHAASSATMIAVDHLQALRLMTLDCVECHPTGMTFTVAAHWTLLRGVLENAARAIWLLGPDDRGERILRVLQQHAANISNSDKAWQLMDTQSPPATKAQRMARLEEIIAQAGLTSGSVFSNRPGYGQMATYAGEFLGDFLGGNLGKHVEFLWRAFSAAAHGDQWAVISLQDKTTISALDGVQTVQLTASIGGLAVATSEVVAMVQAAQALFALRGRA